MTAENQKNSSDGPGLVLEGGTFRPIFSCGVMDALLDENLLFPYCIGVSAGISDAVSYISKQRGRNLEIAKRFRNDKRYLGFRNYRTDRSFFGLNFVFDDIPNKHIPFDYDTYYSYTGKILVGTTNAITGMAEYFDGLQMDHTFSYLRATCAIPLVFPAIPINGIPYYDGGIADPIPIRHAIQDGFHKNLILLTRPKGYEKVLGRSAKAAARHYRKRYPKLSELLLNRHDLYNQTVAFCEKQEAENHAVLLRPEYPIESFEKDTQVLASTYQHGYELAQKNMSRIKQLFLS